MQWTRAASQQWAIPIGSSYLHRCLFLTPRCHRSGKTGRSTTPRSQTQQQQQQQRASGTGLTSSSSFTRRSSSRRQCCWRDTLESTVQRQRKVVKKYVWITTNQPNSKIGLKFNPNYTTKQHAIAVAKLRTGLGVETSTLLQGQSQDLYSTSEKYFGYKGYPHELRLLHCALDPAGAPFQTPLRPPPPTAKPLASPLRNSKQHPTKLVLRVDRNSYEAMLFRFFATLRCRCPISLHWRVPYGTCVLAIVSVNEVTPVVTVLLFCRRVAGVIDIFTTASKVTEISAVVDVRQISVHDWALSVFVSFCGSLFFADTKQERLTC